MPSVSKKTKGSIDHSRIFSIDTPHRLVNGAHNLNHVPSVKSGGNFELDFKTHGGYVWHVSDVVEWNKQQTCADYIDFLKMMTKTVMATRRQLIILLRIKLNIRNNYD